MTKQDYIDEVNRLIQIEKNCALIAMAEQLLDSSPTKEQLKGFYNEYIKN